MVNLALNNSNWSQASFAKFSKCFCDMKLSIGNRTTLTDGPLVQVIVGARDAMTKREKLSSISLSTSFDEPILLHAHGSHLDTNGRHVYSQPGEGNWTSHCGLVVW